MWKNKISSKGFKNKSYDIFFSLTVCFFFFFLFFVYVLELKFGMWSIDMIIINMCTKFGWAVKKYLLLYKVESIENTVLILAYN
jgi:hypothetical protein